MKHLIPLFKEKVDKMIAGLSEKETNGDVDMLDALYMCTLDMITGKNIFIKKEEHLSTAPCKYSY